MGERPDGSAGGSPAERRDVIERNWGTGGNPRADRRGAAGHDRRRVHRGLRSPGVAVGAGAARWLTSRTEKPSLADVFHPWPAWSAAGAGPEGLPPVPNPG